MEEWKNIIGFEQYQVSNHGRIKNTITEKLLSPFISSRGYVSIKLSLSNKKHSFLVHRLVAESFLEKPNEEQLEWAASTKIGKVQVNHIDGNKTNNHISNLEWSTGKENSQHSHDVGLQISHSGENCGRSKLKESEVLNIRKRYDDVNGEHGILTELANEYNINLGTVRKIITRKTWKHI